MYKNLKVLAILLLVSAVALLGWDLFLKPTVVAEGASIVHRFEFEYKHAIDSHDLKHIDALLNSERFYNILKSSLSSYPEIASRISSLEVSFNSTYYPKPEQELGILQVHYKIPSYSTRYTTVNLKDDFTIHHGGNDLVELNQEVEKRMNKIKGILKAHIETLVKSNG